jgi:hypothetical protein
MFGADEILVPAPEVVIHHPEKLLHHGGVSRPVGIRERVALAFITRVSFPVWSLGNYYTQQKPRQYVFEVLIR